LVAPISFRLVSGFDTVMCKPFLKLPASF